MSAVLVDYLAMFSNKNDCFGKLYSTTDAECKKCLHNAMCKKYFEGGIPQEHLDNAKKAGIDTEKLVKKVQKTQKTEVESEEVAKAEVQEAKVEKTVEKKVEPKVQPVTKKASPKTEVQEPKQKHPIKKPNMPTEYGFAVGTITHLCAKLIADGNGITLTDLIEQVNQQQPGKGMFVRMFINNVNKNIYKSATHTVAEKSGKLYLEAK